MTECTVRAAPLEFGFQSRPGYGVAPVRVERSKAAFQLGLLGVGQGKLIVFETVPKLRDEGQPLRGRQTNDLIGSEQFHASQPARKRAGWQCQNSPSPPAPDSAGRTSAVSFLRITDNTPES